MAGDKGHDSSLETEGQHRRTPRQGTAEIGKSRRFVYHRRSVEDLIHRIRNYEQEHPRPVRRSAVNPGADFIDADKERY
jgi:hypothetical protein